MTDSDSPNRAALISAVATVVAIGALPSLHRLGGGDALLAGYALAFIPYAVCLRRLSRRRLPWWSLALAAAAARLLLLPRDPLLSDDIYRYVWDGRVGWAGINPFEYAPDAEALSRLRDAEIWPRINHRSVPTIYPPGAQFVFQLNAALGGGTIGMKGLLLAGETLVLGGAGSLLAAEALGGESEGEPNHTRPDRRQWLFAAYALNPLVIVETAWSGHIDVLAWSLVAAGLLVWERRRRLGGSLVAGALVGASIAVKVLAVFALPLMLLDARRRASVRLAGPLAAVVLVVLTYLPLADAGAQLFGGFGTYADSWRGNDGLYRASRALGSEALHRWTPSQPSDGDQLLFRFDRLDGLFRRLGWTERWQGETIPATTFAADELADLLAKAAGAVAVGLALLWCVILGLAPLRGFAILVGTLYLVAPVLHPWYVAWLIPFAAATRSRALLVFGASVLLGYLAWLSAEHGGDWSVPTAAVVVEYGLVVATAYLDTIRGQSILLPPE